MMRIRIAPAGLALALVASSLTAAAPDGESGLLLQAMRTELDRSMKGLGERGDPGPYFIGYHVTERSGAGVSASFGALRRSSEERSRLLDVELRVGSHELDNTRRLRGDQHRFSFDFSRPVPMPIEDDSEALRSILWLETDRRYKQALEKLIQVKANRTVQVEEEDQAADFSREEPVRHLGPPASLEVDFPAWEKRIRAYSALFNGIPEIEDSSVRLSASATTTYYVNTEGTTVRQGRTRWRLSIQAETRAEDGMELSRFEAFDAFTEEGLPGEEEVSEAVRRLKADLLALRQAPTIEPYDGPAILSGPATGVFFHEIFGHRIEGHRQKDEDEGQTFTKKVKQAILPDFLSVYDDPTLERAGGADLNGHYLFDDEGVPAARVPVVEKGVLRNFLMSRSPIEGFDHSNGHGRKSPGNRPVGRQGNLLVEASETVSEERLRELLVEECRRQGRSYGLYFEEIIGGFTSTRRGGPQAFQVTPVMVYKVHTDGRPDELVRGVNLIGTPLVSFSKILAAGDRREVFNGTCGAESGWVPVSAVAPAILTAQIEIQKKEKSSERPPLLPPPGTGPKGEVLR